LCPRSASRFYILRRIADETNGGICSQLAARVLDTFAKNVYARFAMIAKETEAEELAQPGSFQLMPADGFQIS